MTHNESAQDIEFRAAARSWLAGEAPAKGSDLDFSEHYGMFDGEREAQFLARSREWQQKLHAAGWSGISWPVEYGGRGLTPYQQLIFQQEQERTGATTDAFFVSTGTVGPTIIIHGSEQQRARYLPAILTGEEIWCQLFSEPDAGSDLAGVRTSAVRDGDHWIVNGQKVWTSGAHYADYGFLLARSDAGQPKHRGLTCFVLDLHAPGIEIRPLRQINGTLHFTEVFLHDVRIPAEAAVGEVNDGWSVIRTFLKCERALIGGGRRGPTSIQLRELARRMDVSTSAVVRDGLARAHTHELILDLFEEQQQRTLSDGRDLGAETSLKKLLHARHIKHASELALTMQSAAGMLSGSDALDDGRWAHEVLNAPLFRIAGGTDEIQRNIIGERLLGLPRDA